MEPQHDAPQPQDAKRDEFLKNASPKEKGLFLLLEKVEKLEKESEENPVKVKARWADNGKTESTLRNVIDFQDASYLPFAQPGMQYETFGLTIAYVPTEEDFKLPPKEYQAKLKQYPPYKGSDDMRVYDNAAGGIIKFLANTGGLEHMEAEWSSLIGDIPYPMIVEDRNGLFLSNAAYKNSKT